VLVSIRSRSHIEIDGIRKVLEETAMSAPVLTPVLSQQLLRDGPVSNLTEGSA